MAIELEAEYSKALLERELAYLGYQAAFEIDFVTANFRDIVPTEKANLRCKIEGLDFECCIRKSIPTGLIQLFFRLFLGSKIIHHRFGRLTFRREGDTLPDIKSFNSKSCSEVLNKMAIAESIKKFRAKACILSNKHTL